MFKRILEIESILKRKSLFLFGPRQTGKSTWLRANYPDALYINLLEKRVFDEYTRNPDALGSDIEIFRRKKLPMIVIIDEVQRIPELLNEVHDQIEKNKDLRFILTGSSARKLKRSGANLLGGRASWRAMHPLVYPEISEEILNRKDLEKRLLLGGLPSIFLSEAPFDDFDDYVQLYLNEEIKAEGAVRNHDGFNRFLLTAALSNAKQVNFTEMGSDAQVPPRTIQDYFKILEDTLIGFTLEPFKETPTRKAVSTSKFYLFDTGLTNALLRRTQITAGTTEFGDLFEQFIVLEVKAYLNYTGNRAEIFFWRTSSKIEVDLIIRRGEEIWAIEIKAKGSISKNDAKGLLMFAEDYPKAHKMVITLDARNAIDANHVEIVSSFEFLKRLWKQEIF